MYTARLKDSVNVLFGSYYPFWHFYLDIAIVFQQLQSTIQRGIARVIFTEICYTVTYYHENDVGARQLGKYANEYVLFAKRKLSICVLNAALNMTAHVYCKFISQNKMSDINF